MREDARRITAGSALSASAAAYFLVLPVFLGALGDTYGFDDAELGILGSLYLAGFTIASSLGWFWLPVLNWRRAAEAGMALMIAATLALAVSDSFSVVALAVAAIGIGAGAVFAIATRVLAASRDPDRAFGIKLAAEQLLGTALLFLLPVFVLVRFGLAGFVIALAVVFALIAPAARYIPDDRAVNDANASDGGGRPRAAAVMLFGVLLFMFGLSGVWAFVERAGMESGLDTSTISMLLGIGLLCGGIGGATAGVVGDRFGRLYPHVLAAVLLLVCLVLFSGDLTPARYGVAACLLSGLWNYALAYQMGSIARADANRGLSVLIAPAISLGATLGPVVAGFMKQDSGLLPVLVVAAVSVAVATGIFIAADKGLR